MGMFMLTNGIKVQFIMESMYGLKKGSFYNAIHANSKLGKSEMLCIKDRSGEEYAYPKEWFKLVEE